MSPQPEEPFRRFAEYCDRFAGLWHSIEIRAGSTPVGGRDMVVHLCVRLDPRQPERVAKPVHDPTVAGYAAHWQALPIHDLPRILRELDRGDLLVNGQKLHVEELRQGKVFPYHWWCGFKTRGGWVRDYPFIDGSCAYMHAHGPTVGQLSDSAVSDLDLEHRWRSLSAPFTGGEDVLRSYFGLNVERRSTGCTYHCLAPIPIEFLERTGFANDVLRIGVRATRAANTKEIKIGLVANAGEERVSIDCLSSGWIEEEGGSRCCDIEYTRPGIREAVLLLRYRGVQIEERHAHNPAWPSQNPVVQVHEYFDPQRGVLHKQLFGDAGSEKPPKNFEAGVAWLFGFCGLPPLVYARAGIQDEVDLVIHAPAQRTIACVECTVGGPDKEDKMNKLYKRCRDIEAVAPDWDVLPALATPWKERGVPEDTERAAREKGVALLTRDKLERLEDLGLRNASQQAVLDFLRQCVPQTDLLNELKS